MVSIEGKFDFGMWVLVKSVKEMNSLWNILLTDYRDFIEKRWLTIFTKVSYFPRAYFLDKKQNFDEYIFITEPIVSDLDQKDAKILKLMAPNSRISILDISKKLNLAPKTVTLRIKELERKKVIIGYRTLFDLEKLGYQYFKVHFNLYKVTKDKERKFRAYIKQHPNIIFDNEVLGGDDFEIEVQVRTLQDFRKLMEDIKHQFSDIIKEYKHMLFYKEHKFVFFPV